MIQDPASSTPRRRDLTMPTRTVQENEALAAVGPDDVLHSRRTARELCTARYNQFLNAEPMTPETGTNE